MRHPVAIALVVLLVAATPLPDPDAAPPPAQGTPSLEWHSVDEDASVTESTSPMAPVALALIILGALLILRAHRGRA